MNKQKVIRVMSRTFMGVSAFSILSVSIMAWGSPQSVMDLVQVKLGNTDALSSIRGVYGGVGLLISVVIIYLMIKDLKQGIRFLCMLWGLYALSRIITILVDGKLGVFGTQWLTIESFFFLTATVLSILYKPIAKVHTA